MKYNFNEFKKYISGKNAAVVGIGVSNTPLISMLVDLGAKVTACDKKESLGDLEKKLINMGVNLYLGDNYLEGVLGTDIVFRTPSLRIDNEYLQRAEKCGTYITSEMGEFLKYCPAKVFGITGSDGKTTTTTLISEMLKLEGKRVFLGGNIGNPLLNRIEEINENDCAVVELSSFQLMGCKYSPDISVITNVSPNHLDIHKDMDEYINAKKNIFLNQDEKGTVILNKDNKITYSMRKEVKGEVRLFSLKDKKALAHLEKNMLVINNTEVCSIEDIKLLGMHNIANLLTAFAAVYGYVSLDTMKKVATTFKGVEHRIEFVKELNGIKFYNDSIATSPTRAIAGLKSFKQKVIVIAGGYDKKIPFDEYAKEGINRIKTLIIMGNTKDKIREAFESEMKRKKKNIPIIEAVSLEDAVDKAYKNAEQNDIVTLSPACASFDMFKNFEEKGNKYKEIVNSLK